jgi:hypothetical protein
MTKSGGGKTTKRDVPRKSDTDRRYDGRSRWEYAEEGCEKAIEYLKGLGKTFRNGVADMKAVHAAIEALPPTAVLTTKVADFWLKLTRTQGQRRRGLQPPKSPFKDNAEDSKIQEASKGELQTWDELWVALDSAKKFFSKSGSARTRGIGEMLRTQLPWIITHSGVVIGSAGELPMAKLEDLMAHPEQASMAWLTLERALRRKWADASERVVWMSRYEYASMALVSELKSLSLSAVAADAGPNRPRKPGRDRIL